MITDVWYCNACDAEFDVERNGATKHPCPKCGSKRTERVYVTGGVVYCEGMTKQVKENKGE